MDPQVCNKNSGKWNQQSFSSIFRKWTNVQYLYRIVTYLLSELSMEWVAVKVEETIGLATCLLYNDLINDNLIQDEICKSP